MTAVLSSVAMPTPAPEPRNLANQVQGASPPVQPVGAISALAPRPVEPITSARDARNDTARDKPVGPPPAFEINVLQDMRASQQLPPVSVHNQDNSADSTDPLSARQTALGPAYGTNRDAPDPTVNRKV